MKTKYEIIRSNRKSIAIEIKSDGKVIVRAPRRVSKRDVEAFVRSKEEWIYKHLEQIETEDALQIPKLSEGELGRLTQLAKQIIPARVAYYAPIVGVDYGRITIRHQKTRWGSCSSKGNLNFNCLLMLAPIEVVDSVVVHELCHRKQMNHSREFYKEVYRVYPEYDKWNGWLKEHGGMLLRRMS